MSGKVKIRDPIIAGIAIRNENRPASSLDIPIHNAVEIVMPDLDIPGNKAKACIIPIINAETKDIFFVQVRSFQRSNLGQYSMRPKPRSVSLLTQVRNLIWRS